MPTLVIVESPAKARTISGFLGKEYTVLSSVGHVRDLPKSTIGVDIEHNFSPQYEVTPDKKKVISELKKNMITAEKVILATDEDREGEAIAWHLFEALELSKTDKKVERIVFHEITKSAILESLKTPRHVNTAVVDAQQARRVLDRLVGYELSPLLWRKIQTGLSAGRVQSVAVRLLTEREREIAAFVPEEYWTVSAHFETPEPFSAELHSVNGSPAKLSNEQEVQEVLKNIDDKPWEVSSVESKQKNISPPPPFTTSSLQITASRVLGFSVKKTMQLAQRLYEGAGGPEGLITYMRTDSTHLSGSAVSAARAHILEKYGKEYVPNVPNRFTKKAKGAQEAHEAIRPTRVQLAPGSLPARVTEDAKKLYQLIYQRTLACQMTPARMNLTAANIAVGPAVFRATGQSVGFAGFLAATQNTEKEKYMPKLKEGGTLTPKDIEPLQHFTRPPARFTEASLVKLMEELGIGRPSTYAPTISTIQARGYVEKEGRQLIPTDTGMIVNDFLVQHFSSIVDAAFTAHMESSLDAIAKGDTPWQEPVRDFYTDFHTLIEKGANISREDASKARRLGTCPETGKPVLVKLGRYGPVIQRGETESEEKPHFAPLLPSQKMSSISFEEALQNLTLAKNCRAHSRWQKNNGNGGPFWPLCCGRWRVCFPSRRGAFYPYRRRCQKPYSSKIRRKSKSAGCRLWRY